MMQYATPAGEACYECCNRACQFTAMVGCECAMNIAPEPTPAPTPIVRRTPAERAADKAAYHLAQGLKVITYRGVYLVPSGSRANFIHRVTKGRCSCEASQNGHMCWHVAAVELIEAEQVAA